MKNHIKTNGIELYNLLIAVFLFTSCERNDSPLKIENLKGEWVLSSMELFHPKDSSVRVAESFQTLSFISINDSSKYSYYGIERSNCDFIFRLIESEYKIQKDTLNLYHKSKEKWYEFKLLSLSRDTLNMIDLGSPYADTIQYTRDYKKYTNDPLDFDEIIIKTSRMYCNDLVYVLDKNGALQIFESQEDNISLSQSTYEISTKLSDSLFNNFKYVDLKKISEKNYTTMNTEDLLMSSVFFIKGGEIVKIIDDVHIATPIEFLISYLYIIGLDLKELHRIPNKSNLETQKLVKLVFKHEWR